ncbi:hypothetical protein SAMN06269250_3469 [Spirosoma fluviale]|uniref:Uncharacterized protein n=1 Tax=Spirosoma fluviale TaxID=1597977 RepID=A0A286G4V0_9BACT|nr:hypothetical protein SAMN06269250_3469 [Spirosoma fluviale]
MKNGRNLAIGLVVLCLSCSLEKQQQPTAMKVELDVFSGRPNPTWTLSEEESTELVALLKSLPIAEESSEEGGLGYRGFVLSNFKETEGLPSPIRVYRKTIRMQLDRPQSFQDIHGVERQLLQQASQRGYGAIVDSL